MGSDFVKGAAEWALYRVIVTLPVVVNKGHLFREPDIVKISQNSIQVKSSKVIMEGHPEGNLAARQSVLKAFSLNEDSLEYNFRYTMEHLMSQKVAAEDEVDLVKALEAEQEQVDLVIEEEQASKTQISVLSEIQLQALESVRAEEKN